jgi:hypothetical protein
LLEATDDKGRKYLKFEAEIQRADTPNRNGRVYPKPVLKREVERYRKRINERTALMGEGDHPAGAPSVSRTAVLWEDVWMQDDGRVFGRAKIVPTAVGKDLQAIIEAGGTIGISSRGRGDVTSREHGGRMADVVNENFELLTFDVVTDPSVGTARPTRVFLEAFSADESTAAVQTGVKNMDPKEALAGIKTAAELKALAPSLHESLVKEIGGEFRRRMEPEVARLVEAAGAKKLAEAKAAGRLIESADAAKRGKLDEAVKAFATALEEAGVVSKLPPSDKALAEENAKLKAQVARLNEENDKLASALNEASDVIESNVLRESVRAAAAADPKIAKHPLQGEIVLRALAETTKPSEAKARLDEAAEYFDGLSKKLAPTAVKPAEDQRPAGLGRRIVGGADLTAPVTAQKRLDEAREKRLDEARGPEKKNGETASPLRRAVLGG